MSIPPHESPPSLSWYVYVDAQIYGPFDGRAMAEFFREGRLTAGSHLSPDANGPFSPASQWADYADWTQPPVQPVQTSAQPLDSNYGKAASAKPLSVFQPNPAATQTPSTQSPYVHLIMAETRSSQGMTFLKTLQSIGSVERVSNTLWLARTSLGAESVKSVLAPTLTGQDRLLIIDVTHQPLLAINLGQAVDAKIAGLFKDID